MAANDIQISDLTYDGIRNSLVNYLKTQDTFKDYNFEGSAIRTLVDLLAYNTFYYGYYANMIANEMFLDTAKLQSSLIALSKPLGYMVPGFMSARANLQLLNINLPLSKQLSAFSTFKANDATGKPYFFYNITPVPIEQISGSNYRTAEFTVYEGKSAVIRQLIAVDLANQNFKLSGVDIDPRTITIEVKYSGATAYTKWESYYLNPEVVIGNNTEVFFPERTTNGYKINFGKYSSADTTSVSTGKLILQGDEVYVSYLISSGSDGNNISNFSFVLDALGNSLKKANTTTKRITVSLGGVAQPSPNEVRFFAPKTFARQNRLVTKNDYVAIMNELGYKSANDNPDFKFKIFGGEEMSPPIYGRLFVSILGIDPTTGQNEINQVLSTLKSKSVVTILPEYLSPVEAKMTLDITYAIPNRTSARAAQSIAAVQSTLSSNYTAKKFNRNVNKLEIAELLRNSFSNLRVFPENIKLRFRVNIAEIAEGLGSVGRRVNIRNKIKKPIGSNFTIEAVTSSGTSIKNSAETGKFLYVYNSQGIRQSIVAGEVNYNDGVVIIYPEITSNALTFFFELEDDIFTAKDQLVCYLPSAGPSDVTLTVNGI